MPFVVGSKNGSRLTLVRQALKVRRVSTTKPNGRPTTTPSKVKFQIEGSCGAFNQKTDDTTIYVREIEYVVSDQIVAMDKEISAMQKAFSAKCDEREHLIRTAFAEGRPLTTEEVVGKIPDAS